MLKATLPRENLKIQSLAAGETLKRYVQDYTSLLILSGLIIGLDQLTKGIVRASLPIEGVWSPWFWMTPYARIVHWKNTGAAFGMLQNFGDVFTVLAILVAIAIIYYFPQVPRKDWPLRLAMCMQLGGAIGNLIDRLSQGYVTDFISVGTFPVFNIADASISIGVAILILGMWFMERAQKNTGDDRAQGVMSTSISEEAKGE